MFLTFKQQATSTGLDKSKDSIVLIRRKDSVFGGNLVRKEKQKRKLFELCSINTCQCQAAWMVLEGKVAGIYQVIDI